MTEPTSIPVVPPEVQMQAMRDRSLQFATSTAPSSVEELINNADLILAYLLNGSNPFVTSDTQSL